MYSSLLIGSAPDDGWFNYAPLSLRCRPGSNIDFYALGLIFLGISTTAGAINFIVTIVKPARAGHVDQPHAALLLGDAGDVALDRLRVPVADRATACCSSCSGTWGYHFFDSAHGGDPLLWQHLFWIFGHPDVYIIFLPAVGIVSSIVPVFSRRPMVAHHVGCIWRRWRPAFARLRRLGAPHVRGRAAAVSR